MTNARNAHDAGAGRRPATTIDLARDDARSTVLGTASYRPGCIAGWGPKLA